MLVSAVPQEMRVAAYSYNQALQVQKGQVVGDSLVHDSIETAC